MSTYLGEPPIRNVRMFRTGPTLDQGETPRCVGYASRGWLSAGLVMEHGGPDADAIYFAAQALDTLPLPHDGSTVRAAMQALKALGYVKTYVWAFRAEDVRDWHLAGKGSVILGTDWTVGMDNPGPDGVIHATGDVRGGHAYLCVGYDGVRGAFRIHNSWSDAWGQRGRAWLPFNDLAQLLERNGEAVTAVQSRPVRLGSGDHLTLLTAAQPAVPLPIGAEEGDLYVAHSTDRIARVRRPVVGVE
jgi:hypothetical protein